MTTDGSKQSRTLALRTTIGVVWLIGTRLCLRSIGLISTIVLARILVPEDFGLVAIATAFAAMLDGASVLGFNAALIKFQDHNRDDLDTAWTLNLIRGFILALLVLVAAVYLPASLDEPRLRAILMVIALNPVIAGFKNTALIGFEKELDYSREAYLLVIGKIAATITTISIAVMYQTYWALIAGMLIGAFSRTIVGYIIYPYLPKICFKSSRKLFSFSIWLSFSHFINATSANFDKMVSAAIFETRLTGIYHMGQEISALLTREIFRPLNRALYPGLAKFSNNIEKLKVNALESVSILAAIGFPVGIGFAFTATEFVPIVLGQKWLEIIPMVQILAPILGLQTLTNATHASLLSLGMTRTLFFRSLCSFAIRLPLLIVGGYHFGFTGLIIAHAASELVFFFLNYLVLAKAIDCKVPELFLVAKRSFISVAAMSAILIFIHYQINTSPDDYPVLILSMTLKVLLGGATYIGVHYLLWRQEGRPAGVETRMFQMYNSMIERFMPARSANRQDLK